MMGEAVDGSFCRMKSWNRNQESVLRRVVSYGFVGKSITSAQQVLA